MQEYTVMVNSPGLLETDCRIIKVLAQSVDEVFNQVNPGLADHEYVHHITLKFSEDELARVVWKYIECEE